MKRRLHLLGLLGATGLAASFVACAGDSAAPIERLTAPELSAEDGTVAAQAKEPRVTVCHVRGNGTYELLEINGNAEAAHLAHGDGKPGELVPGDPTMKFDAACGQIAASGCADGTTDGGVEVFGRDDIVFCDAAGGSYPEFSAAKALCAEGWHVPTEAEWYAMNDSCTKLALEFTAWIDTGPIGTPGVDGCFVVNGSNPPVARHNCSVDAVRGERFRGTCSGPVLPPTDGVGDGAGWSLQGPDSRLPNQSPPTGIGCGDGPGGGFGGNCGAICVLD